MVNSMSDIGSINIELDSIESSPLLARVSDCFINLNVLFTAMFEVKSSNSRRVLCIVQHNLFIANFRGKHKKLRYSLNSL